MPKYVRAIPTRFVITDKNEALRTKESNLPMLLKARLVVLGNFEKDSTFRRDAPTASLLAQHMVLAWAASAGGGPRGRKRPVRKLDAKTAFLQGDEISRELYLRPPAGGIPGVKLPSGCSLKAKVPIYGAGDAARGWWKKIARSLVAVGWKPSSIEAATFYLWSKGKELVGVCSTHVDDVLTAGSGAYFEESIEKLKQLIDFGEDKLLKFQHCGKLIEQQADGTIEVSQKEFAMNIKPIVISPSRRRARTEPCTPLEITMLRQRYGSLA